MLDTVNHHSTRFVHSSWLSRRSARCFLSQLSLVTDEFWYYRFFRSRRFVRPARLVLRSCRFLCFAFSSHVRPFALILLVALVFAALNYSPFLDSSLLTVRLRAFLFWILLSVVPRITFRFPWFYRPRGISVGPLFSSTLFSRRSKGNTISP